MLVDLMNRNGFESCPALRMELEGHHLALTVRFRLRLHPDQLPDAGQSALRSCEASYGPDSRCL